MVNLLAPAADNGTQVHCYELGSESAMFLDENKALMNADAVDAMSATEAVDLVFLSKDV